MDHADLLALYDRYSRIELQLPDMQKEIFPHLVRFLRPAPGSSMITYARLDPAQADAQIDEQLAFFQSNRLPFSWTVFEHDQPADLCDRLAARGLTVYEEEQIMVLDLQDAPEALLRLPAALVQPDLAAEIRVIDRPEQLDDIEGVLKGVWGGSFAWIHERLGRQLAIPGFLYITAAFVNGQAASAGWVFLYPDNPFAGLYGGSTLPEYRGRGLYTALLAARLQEASRRGYRFLTIDAGPMSASIVSRHGFQRIARARDCDLEVPEGEDLAAPGGR
jgi:GNAT superfamily N-acetyltransferase